MTATANDSSRPRTLTDAVRARQARQSRSRSAPRSAPARRKSSSGNGAARARRGGGAASWLSRLLTPLKRWGRKLVEVFEALLGDRSTGLRKFGALLAAGMLAKRLPGPLGSLARTLISGLKGDRGFGFWWLVVTLAVALALGIILAILLSPVAAVIALLVVGIWMLLHRARNKDEDQDGSQSDSGERNSPSEPGIASSGS